MIFNSTQLKPLRLIFMLYFIYIYIRCMLRRKLQLQKNTERNLYGKIV